MAMSVGSYNDMVVLFEKKNVANVNNQIDSLASSVGISMTGDSTMSIANFPIAAIAEHISNKELSQAIAKEAPRTITCKYNVMPNSTSEQQDIPWKRNRIYRHDRCREQVGCRFGSENI